MDARLFLATQPWLVPLHDPPPGPPPAAAGAAPAAAVGAKRGRDAGEEEASAHGVAVTLLFHLVLHEQAGEPGAGGWGGHSSPASVPVRLRCGAGGAIRSRLDATVALSQQPQQQPQQPLQPAQPALVLHVPALGASYALAGLAGVRKIVCSPAVLAVARVASPSGLHGQPGCLLAPEAQAAPSQVPGLRLEAPPEYATLVRQHVCLSLLVPREAQAAAELGRLVAALHAAAPCSSAAGAALPPPAGPLSVEHWLAGAEAEAQLLQLLLDTASRGGALRPSQQQHLLDAVAHVHAGLQP